mmetsp:Transcript_30328/g.93872  ORF Transcript_30328/g.93872 Transcript_30328/m.93872 type:complete len:271 (-) Transcript_30328:16-828(-)
MGKGGANPPKAAPEAPELNPKQFVVPFLVITSKILKLDFAPYVSEIRLAFFLAVSLSVLAYVGIYVIAGKKNEAGEVTDTAKTMQGKDETTKYTVAAYPDRADIAPSGPGLRCASSGRHEHRQRGKHEQERGTAEIGSASQVRPEKGRGGAAADDADRRDGQFYPLQVGQPHAARVPVHHAAHEHARRAARKNPLLLREANRQARAAVEGAAEPAAGDAGRGQGGREGRRAETGLRVDIVLFFFSRAAAPSTRRRGDSLDRSAFSFGACN